MTDAVRFVYGFEYEEHADAFLAQARDAGYEADLDVRDDGIEAVSVIANADAEQRLDHLAEQSFGHALGGRPAD